MKPRAFWKSSHAVPLLVLFALCTLYWSRVLFSNTVLLPDFLRGYAPFGNEHTADFNILQWDSLVQYFPWRTFAARELQQNHIPLWNPHQFSGTPFLANGQSAVFYPLSAPFYLFDVARAFGISAWMHSLLAAFSTYYLCQRWKLSRAASLFAAVAFAFCGFLTFWITLPTLSNTASWLPLLLLLFECAAEKRAVEKPPESNIAAHRVLDFSRAHDFWLLVAALSCAYLAGHPQIFFYCVVALFLRALTSSLPRWKGAFALLLSCLGATVAACAMQLLPTLELARLGHRAGAVADANGWQFMTRNALHTSDLSSLWTPFYATFSFDENKAYVGAAVLLLSAVGVVFAVARRSRKAESSTRSETDRCDSPLFFAIALAFFGLFYALATPLSQFFYFFVPTVAQTGGVGRALCLWSLGAALLAAFGLDALRLRIKSPVLPLVALLLLTGELFAASWNAQPTAPRQAIYPDTTLTTFLQSATKNGGRVLFWSSRKRWLAGEDLPRNTKIFDRQSVLPPNGATVYGIDDVNGYDSLSSAAYRQFLIANEGADVSPLRNGNVVLLNNLASPALDALEVRFVVMPETVLHDGLTVHHAHEVLRTDECIVFERDRVLDVRKTALKSGRDFFPGWTGKVYNPTSFRLGAFFSLLILSLMSASFGARIATARAHFRPTK